MRSKRQNPLPPKLAGWCCLERRRLEKIVQKPFGAKADEEAKRYAVRAGQRRRIQPITDGIGSDNGMLSEVMPPCRAGRSFGKGRRCPGGNRASSPTPNLNNDYQLLRSIGPNGLFELGIAPAAPSMIRCQL